MPDTQPRIIGCLTSDGELVGAYYEKNELNTIILEQLENLITSLENKGSDLSSNKYDKSIVPLPLCN